MDFTTIEKVKEYLGGEFGSDKDSVLASLIAQVSAYVRKKCQNNILAADYIEYYDGDGSNTLLLRQFPINSIDSIYDDNTYIFDLPTQIPPGDIIPSSAGNTEMAKTGIIKLKDNIFSTGEQNIKITYNAGYMAVPEDLELGVIKLVGACFLEGTGSIDAMATEGADDKPTRLERKSKDFMLPYMRIK